MDLETRLATNVWHPQHGPPSATGSAEDGDHVRLVFEFFLTILKDSKYLERIQPNDNTGQIPLAARDTTKFHRVYWSAFQQVCGAEFHSLSYDEQRTALTNFFLKTLSTDPEGKQMEPPTGKKRKTLSWRGFWLSDEEAKDIVETILQYYHTARADGFT